MTSRSVSKGAAHRSKAISHGMNLEEVLDEMLLGILHEYRALHHNKDAFDPTRSGLDQTFPVTRITQMFDHLKVELGQVLPSPLDWPAVVVATEADDGALGRLRCGFLSSRQAEPIGIGHGGLPTECTGNEEPLNGGNAKSRAEEDDDVGEHPRMRLQKGSAGNVRGEDSQELRIGGRSKRGKKARSGKAITTQTLAFSESRISQGEIKDLVKRLEADLQAKETKQAEILKEDIRRQVMEDLRDEIRLGMVNHSTRFVQHGELKRHGAKMEKLGKTVAGLQDEVNDIDTLVHAEVYEAVEPLRLSYRENLADALSIVHDEAKSQRAEMDRMVRVLKINTDNVRALSEGLKDAQRINDQLSQNLHAAWRSIRARDAVESEDNSTSKFEVRHRLDSAHPVEQPGNLVVTKVKLPIPGRSSGATSKPGQVVEEETDSLSRRGRRLRHQPPVPELDPVPLVSTPPATPQPPSTPADDQAEATSCPPEPNAVERTSVPTSASTHITRRPLRAIRNEVPANDLSAMEDFITTCLAWIVALGIIAKGFSYLFDVSWPRHTEDVLPAKLRNEYRIWAHR